MRRVLTRQRSPSRTTKRSNGWRRELQPTETVRKLLVISGVWSQYEATRSAKPAKDRTRPARKSPATKSAPKKKPAGAKTAATAAPAEEG